MFNLLGHTYSWAPCRSLKDVRGITSRPMHGALWPITLVPAGELHTAFGTRLNAETIAEVEALKAGPRLKMQGKAIERAVAFYRAHIIDKTRREFGLAAQVDDEAVLTKAFKCDD